jgi:two-component system, LytTR family, sensor kinase
VENAIVHGVECCRAGGWIEISSRPAENAVEIQIRNSAGAEKREGLGVGLQNTKARLNYLYANEASFSFRREENGIVVATLVLPAIGQHEKTSEEAVPASAQN